MMAAVPALLALFAPSATGDTKRELAAAKAKLKAIQKHIKSTEQRLQLLRGQGDAIVAQMNGVASTIAVIQAQEDRVRQDITKARGRLSDIQGQLDSRARVTYQTGGGLSLEFLLGSNSLSDLSSRLEIVDRATDSDRELIERVQALDAELRNREVILQQLEVRRLGKNKDLLSQQAQLQRQLSTEQKDMGQLKKDEAKAAAIAKKLGTQFQQQVADAHQRALVSSTKRSLFTPPPSGPRPIPGAVFQVCPVDPPHHYVDDFGAPRAGHTHQGNDIMAPYGTPIRAPFPGTTKVSNSYAGGLAVYVHGSKGFVYNAHMSRTAKLGTVKAGTIIGYVGQSGNARYTAPHDHFEWHPGNGAAISPFPYLNQVC
jgi:peptidoglycan LD-endopeptidase LytH